MTRPIFSPELFNARVETQIQAFFDTMNNLYGRRGWFPDPPRRSDSTWSNTDFTVAIIERYHDGAYKRVRFIMRNLPGYVRQPQSLMDERAISYEHQFAFDLPREYPQNIGSIRPTAERPLYHPRLSTSGKGLACYSVRGELDRILEDLPFFVLLKPDRVEPPSQFQSDRGLNSTAMAWYEQNAENIVTSLNQLWEQRHQAESTNQVKHERVRILSLSTTAKTSRKHAPRILDKPIKQSGKVKILGSPDENAEAR